MQRMSNISRTVRETKGDDKRIVRHRLFTVVNFFSFGSLFVRWAMLCFGVVLAAETRRDQRPESAEALEEEVDGKKWVGEAIVEVEDAEESSVASDSEGFVRSSGEDDIFLESSSEDDSGVSEDSDVVVELKRRRNRTKKRRKSRKEGSHSVGEDEKASQRSLPREKMQSSSSSSQGALRAENESERSVLERKRRRSAMVEEEKKKRLKRTEKKEHRKFKENKVRLDRYLWVEEKKKREGE